MTQAHIGNNVWLIRSSEGDSIENIPAAVNAVCIDIDTGKISNYTGNAWNSVSFGSRNDQLFIQITRQVPLTNIGTSFIDVFGAFYGGFPNALDTHGFKRLGIIVLWNKNGGTGRHDMRLVNANNTTQVMATTEGMTVEFNGSDGLVNGTTKNYNVDIPVEFMDWIGEVKIQAKSTVATDDPIFDAFVLYLRR